MIRLALSSIALLAVGSASYAGDCNAPPVDPPVQFRAVPVQRAQPQVRFVPVQQQQPQVQFRAVPVVQAQPRVTYMVIEETVEAPVVRFQAAPVVRFAAPPPVVFQAVPTTRETTIQRGPLGRVRSVKTVER